MSPTRGDTVAAGESAPVDARLIELGRISGVFGVRGWIRIHSFTEPRANIIGYRSWMLLYPGGQHRVAVEGHQLHGKSVLAKLEGVEDRDEASALIGAVVAVTRDELPECEPGEYYWADLEGLEVVDLEGRSLGRVDHMIATGAHDVMVLDGARGRLIPFVTGRTVTDVDRKRGVIVVDWDLAWWE